MTGAVAARAWDAGGAWAGTGRGDRSCVDAMATSTGYRGLISPWLLRRKFRVNTADSGPRVLGLERRRFRFGQERPDLTPKLVLNHVDLATCVEHAKPELVGHRCVLAQQRTLVR